MQLAEHEAYQLHELAMSCVNSIVNMGLFINQAQDPELKQLLQQHLPYHIRDYNKKVEYLQQPQGSTVPFPVPEIRGTLPSTTEAPAAPAPAVTPRTNAQAFNDREIATAYLLTLKRAGREYAWAAMEMANPELRTFLEDAFRMSSHHAYDVWQWMVKRGYYPLTAAPQPTLQTMGNLYNLVPEPQGALPPS